MIMQEIHMLIVTNQITNIPDSQSNQSFTSYQPINFQSSANQTRRLCRKKTHAKVSVKKAISCVKKLQKNWRVKNTKIQPLFIHSRFLTFFSLGLVFHIYSFLLSQRRYLLSFYRTSDSFRLFLFISSVPIHTHPTLPYQSDTLIYIP